MHRVLIAFIAATLSSCDPAPSSNGAAAAAGTANATETSQAPQLVEPPDSAGMTPRIAEALGRFREGLGSAPERLADGAAESRDALVDRYVHALETADSAAFGPMMISRAEFAWLYYPFTDYTRPPYELDPDVVWLLISENAQKGIGRSLREFGGRPLGFTGYRCSPEPKPVGPNRLWEGCVLEVEIDGDAATTRFFGSIIERGGRFKFMSYANDL